MEVCIFGLGYISLSIARIALVGFPPHPTSPPAIEKEMRKTLRT
jgi:hypothetical protein